MRDTFQLAVQRAEAAFGDCWASIPSKERAAAIYCELRKIDAEQVASVPQSQEPPEQKAL